jgi:hypothetical protein
MVGRAKKDLRKWPLNMIQPRWNLFADLLSHCEADYRWSTRYFTWATSTGSTQWQQLCCWAVGMAGDASSGFKDPVIFQKIRDAGSQMGAVYRASTNIPALRGPAASGTGPELIIDPSYFGFWNCRGIHANRTMNQKN